MEDGFEEEDGFEDEPWFALLRASGRQEKKSE
jgi:hypothetical protein